MLSVKLGRFAFWLCLIDILIMVLLQPYYPEPPGPVWGLVGLTFGVLGAYIYVLFNE